ncbi:MAG: iron-containing alcohol dehydrogenase [Treponema sp.]|jgi:alcohol dehydrogenase|nr:iron-containing alcohol dehydrogenase [Treponema sp.]
MKPAGKQEAVGTHYGRKMDIAFKFDPEILIGANTLSMAGTVCKRHGKRVMIAADHSLDEAVVNRLKEILEDSGLDAIIFNGIEDDSGVEMAENVVELSRAAHCDAIIGFGGCKSQVIARMAAIMAPFRISAFELLDGRMFENKFLPLLAIPTKGLDTFSLTDYFLVSDPRTRLIKSIKSPPNLYSAVIIDSSLQTFLADTGAAAFIFDGFFSAVEAYCSSKANFLSDALLERSISFYAKLFKTALNPDAGGTNNELISGTYAQASFLGALGTAASSPGAGSALAAAINTRFPVSKQQCTASLLAPIAEKLSSARPEKMARVASSIGAGKAASVAEAAAASVGAIRRCMETFKLQASLKEFNITLDKVTASVEAARNLDFVSNSPWIVSEEDVFNIIKQII